MPCPIISHDAKEVNYPRYVQIGQKVFPVLMGEVVGLPNHPQVKVWCPNCKRHHHHGYDPGDPRSGSGHRAAHCLERIYESGRRYPRITSEEFRNTGYFIILPGQRLRDLMRFEDYWFEVESSGEEGADG